MSQSMQATPDTEKAFQNLEEKYLAMLKAEGKGGELTALPQKAAVSTASAEASLNFWVLKGHITAELIFKDSNKTVKFDAWPWGIGQGVGSGLGGYFGVDANTLVGDCHYHCQWGAVGAGILQITMWREGFGALGQINCAFAGEGAGETGGNDGKLTAA